MDGQFSKIKVAAARRTLLLCAALAAPATAAEAPESLAAGYKALFSCSATFLAGRSAEQIGRNDLSGIYRDYEAVVARLPAAQIDRAAQRVSVAFDSDLPPRSARRHGALGCALLPPGATIDAPLPGDTLKLPPPPATEQDWPAGDRLRRPPTGPNSAGTPLAQALARAFDGSSYGTGSRTSAVVVVSGPDIAAEAYLSDSGMHVPQRTWSVAKTIMGALVGIAAGEGLLDPERPPGLPQWSGAGDPRGRILVRHLLHMASGLDAGASGSRTDQVYFGGARVEDTALVNTLVAAPGTRWFYANNDTLALSHALRLRIGDDAAYLRYPWERLFRRIGMQHTTPETDWSGTFILSSQVWTTARDLARFGMLLRDDGMWNGARILPAGWVGFMTTPAPAQPAAAGPGYGAQVWLYGAHQGLPPGSFSALGNRGQYVMVIPARGVVIVRRGYDPEGGPFAIDRFSADVLAALAD